MPVTPSISAPVVQMNPVSPVAMPWSMILAFRLGRYSAAALAISWTRTTSQSRPV